MGAYAFPAIEDRIGEKATQQIPRESHDAMPAKKTVSILSGY